LEKHHGKVANGLHAGAEGGATRLGGDFVANVASQAAAYGIPAAMMTQFTQINTDLRAAWVVSSNRDTRTHKTVTLTTICCSRCGSWPGACR
jgi:hypothetical protein